MTDAHVNPENVSISSLNERKSEIDTADLVDSIEDEGIIEGLEPVVRPADDDDDHDYEAFIGQRRIHAAREVGLDEIPVNISERGDEAALKASIIENIDLFKDSVPTSDRASALDRLWEFMGGEGFPSSTDLSDELNVPESTVRTWLEPLRDEWEGTDVDPTSTETDNETDEDDGAGEEEDTEEAEASVDVEDVADDEEVNDDAVEFTEDREPDGPDASFQSEAEPDEIHDPNAPSTIEPISDDDEDDTDTAGAEVEEAGGTAEAADVEAGGASDEAAADADVEEDDEEDSQINIVDELGEDKLRKIRTMTGGGEAGEELAKRVAEEGLTNKEVEKVKTLHERGNDIDEAIEKVQGDDADKDEYRVREEVELDGDTAEEVERLAEERGVTEEEVIVDAVEAYLEDE